MAVQNKLARRFARWRKVQAIDHGIEPPFEELDHVLARDAAKARGLLERIAELRFEHSIQAADLLLLAKLNAVFGYFLATAKAVLTRWVCTLLDGALLGVTLCALEE